MEHLPLDKPESSQAHEPGSSGAAREYSTPETEPPESVRRRAELEPYDHSRPAWAHPFRLSNPAAEVRVQGILAGIKAAHERYAQECAAYYAEHPEVESPEPEPNFMLDGQTGYFYEEMPDGSLRYAGEAARQTWA